MLEKRQVITVGYFSNMVLTCYFDISNNLNAICLLTDVMEELGLGHVDDLEGNFGPGWILHDSLNVFFWFFGLNFF